MEQADLRRKTGLLIKRRRTLEVVAEAKGQNIRVIVPLYLPFCGTIFPLMKNRGLIDRRFHGLHQTECQRGSSGPLTCKARTVARATEPAFRKAGHDRRRL
jgi:hypothetical protein